MTPEERQPAQAQSRPATSETGMGLDIFHQIL